MRFFLGIQDPLHIITYFYFFMSFVAVSHDLTHPHLSSNCFFFTNPCLEVSTMFLSEHQNQNIQISAYLSHFFYAKNYFNFFVFMI